MDDQTNTIDLELFKQNWQTYKTIIDENYMFHREAIEQARLCLSASFANKPIAVLDLGCGDASNVAKALQGFTIEFFCGYDLSAMALQLAEKNIAELTANFQLNCQDMFTGVAEKIAEFELVFSIYSLHHFQLADKAALFHSAYSALRTGGAFMLLDIVRADNETLHDYYDHYLDYIGENWLALNEQEIQRVSDHVRCSDFPENVQTLQRIAVAAGFDNYDILAKHNWHQLMVFYKH